MLKSVLDNAAVDAASELVASFLSGEKLDEQQILHVRLTVEEVLLYEQMVLGDTAHFTLQCSKRLGKLRIELAIPGQRADPFATDSQITEDGTDLMRGLLEGLGYAPIWQYRNGVNLVTFTPEQEKPSQFQALMMALILALVGGGICRFMPEATVHFLTRELIGPLCDAFMGLLSAVAGPMIFLTVAWGIYSIGDTAALGRIGRRMICRFLRISVLVGAGTALCFLPFFSIDAGGSGNAPNLSALSPLLLDMIPHNLLTPFTDNNPTQLVAVAIGLGLVLLVMGTKTTTAAAMVDQLGQVFQMLMAGVSRLVPIFVFGIVLNLVANQGLGVLQKSYKLLPLMLGMQVLLLGIYVLAICLRRKVKISVLLRKLMPTFLVGLTTASSSAALATNVEVCERDLGLDQRIINFGLPLGQVLFMPGLIIKFLASALCMAELYQVAITPGWLISAVLITVVLATAAPPVPGGAMSCYTLLFLQLGLPEESIAIMITFNVILEFLSTAVNIASLQMELIEVSDSLGMLDLETLQRATS